MLLLPVHKADLEIKIRYNSGEPSNPVDTSRISIPLISGVVDPTEILNNVNRVQFCHINSDFFTGIESKFTHTR